jgi:hypothetical protein
MRVGTWVAALAGLLACVALYIAQISAHRLAHTWHSGPITLAGAAVVFFVIAWPQNESGWRVALGSAAVGAAAGPMIFELAFDLIIMARTRSSVDTSLFQLLLFGTLILVDIMTLALAWLSPAVRVRRSTLWCLAGMLALFASWALLGFSYPSAPGPVTLNALSKILALATALTLLLPQQPLSGIHNLRQLAARRRTSCIAAPRLRAKARPRPRAAKFASHPPREPDRAPGWSPF